MTSERAATIAPMRVGVVDVGSNTVRLLVAARRSRCVEPLLEQRAYLRLGDEIERLGWISEAKLREAVETVRRYAAAADELGAHQLEVVVTAPGRRAANADELVAALAQGAGADVRVLSSQEEAELAFTGALSCLDRIPDTVAVCDSGGGSTELVVGTAAGPQWVRSVDIGSLTVRRMLPDDPPGKKAVATARAEVRERLEGLTPPLPKAAYATGGTARALRRLNGRVLGAKELELALKRLARSSAAEIASESGLDVERAWTLVGGAVVLAEVQLRLGVPFEVSRTGMREGVATTAFAALAAA
jgi:exopolyphosphatase / guanosine-5'-triphosphate,3'-diphosphate pyrophosphatase